MRNLLLNGVVLVSFLTFSTQSCIAGTGTATLAVSATILTVCTIVAFPLGFGNYVSTVASTAATNVNVVCTLSAPYNVGLDAGTGNGASVTNRKMTNGTSTLSYQLTQDSSHSINFGQTVGTDTVAGIGNGLIQSVPIYGRIPAGQNAATGAFLDTVTATITY